MTSINFYTGDDYGVAPYLIATDTQRPRAFNMKPDYGIAPSLGRDDTV